MKQYGKTIFIDELRSQVQEHIETIQGLNEGSLGQILEVSDYIISAFKKGNKVFLCGNGGSAADSQHIAAEFINRFRRERIPLPAVALTTDTSVITSISNDYDFEDIFSKQIAALGNKGDVLIAISTSGTAKNVIKAIYTARKKGIHTIGLTGDGGGKFKGAVDLCISVPSHDTPRIQEAHILIGHLICDVIEKKMFNR